MSDYTETRKKVEKAFTGIIGMEELKNLMIEGTMSLWNGGEGFSGTLIGEAGKGKSALLEAYAKALEAIDVLPILTTPSEFRKSGDETWGEIMNALCERRAKYALLVDEGHELFQSGATVQLKKVAAFCMKGLDGNFQGGTIRLGDNIIAEFSRKNSVMMLATNHPNYLPDALCGDNGRTVRYILPDYSDGELQKIFGRMLLRFGLECGDKKAAKRIVDCARGTARPLEKIVRQLSISLGATEKSRKVVNADDVTHALRQLQMFPRGLNVTEMQMLERLAMNPVPDRIIQQMFPGSDTGTLRKSRAYLMLCGSEMDEKTGKQGLPFVAPVVGGSQTTDKGRRFLADCAKSGFSWR